MPIAGDGKTVISNYNAAEQVAAMINNPKEKATAFAMLAVADQLRLQNQIELAKLIHETEDLPIDKAHRMNMRASLGELLKAVQEQ